MLRLVAQNRGFAGALPLFAVLFLIYNLLHPRGFSSAVLVQNANESVAIAFVAMAQTVPVLMRRPRPLGRRGDDADHLHRLRTCLTARRRRSRFGMVATLAAGTAFGLMNGLIVVYGRIQPIIATLATGAIAIGLALLIRPQPGGDVDDDLGWALTNSLCDFADTYGLADGGEAWWLPPFAEIPVPLILLFVVACLVWVPFRRTVTGRTIYAIGSAEGAAYMSGLPIARAKIAAFTLAGFFAACGGLYLAIQTSPGNADTCRPAPIR